MLSMSATFSMLSEKGVRKKYDIPLPALKLCCYRYPEYPFANYTMLQPLLIILNGLWCIAILSLLWPVVRTYFNRQQLTAQHCHEQRPEHNVSIIVPVRNEERNMARLLEAITRLDYPKERLEVLIVNDGSTDNTAEIVRQYATAHHHIRLLDAPPLRNGWSGKSNACQFGAVASSGEWLIFLDADTFVEPPALCAAISYAASEELALLSLIPFQIIASVEERMVLPAVFVCLASAVDFGRVNNPDAADSVANGQFMLFSRTGYERIGGHRSVIEELSDDLALARRAKRLGMNFRCLFAEELVATRMYHSLAEVWAGFSRNASEIMAVGTVAQLVMLMLRSFAVGSGMLLLPMCAVMLDGDSLGAIPITSVAILLLLLISFGFALREMRVPFGYLLALPFGLLLHALLLLNSWRQKRGGRIWKGRSYTSIH